MKTFRANKITELEYSFARRRKFPGGLAETITVVGHPFAPIGMGEQMRAHVAAMSSVHLDVGVYDIFRYSNRDDDLYLQQIGPLEQSTLGKGVRIFHMNGDEIQNAISALERQNQDFHGGYNVIVPAWELPRYPNIWVKELKKFDEVWALSTFIQESLKESGIESFFVGQSAEILRQPFLPRKYFGIRESAFALLHFFDVTSFASRKNPEAVLELYSGLLAELPFADARLVLKVKKAGEGAKEWLTPIRERFPDIIAIDKPLSAFETHSLINACDCFVSLHRSEGFGRGLAEAMSLGRLAMGTAWSGNADFMTSENSLFVNFSLQAVKEGDYPHADGQSWAEPDVKHALRLLKDVVSRPDKGRAIAALGQSDIYLSCSHRAVGLRTLDRILDILKVYK